MPVWVESLEPTKLFTGARVSIGGALRFTYGLYAGYPGPGTIWAGFQYSCFPPDGGLFGVLHEQDDYLYRGGVQFDLSKFQNMLRDGEYGFWLISARLEFWQQEPSDPNIPSKLGFDSSSTLIFTASGDWADEVHEVLDNYLIPTSGKDEDYINTIPPYAPPEGGGLSGLMGVDVYYTVWDWIRGAQSNYGLCFMGTDESMPGTEPPLSGPLIREGVNRTGVSQFGNFQLIITYATDAKPIFPGPKKMELPPQILPPRPRNPPSFTMTTGRLPESFQRRLNEPHPNLRVHDAETSKVTEVSQKTAGTHADPSRAPKKGSSLRAGKRKPPTR